LIDTNVLHWNINQTLVIFLQGLLNFKTGGLDFRQQSI